MAKMSFAQHLEWKGEENLGGKLYRLKKEEKLLGIKEEIEQYVEKYQLPPPTKLLTKIQYKRVLKKSIKHEARLEIWKQLLESSKLSHLASRNQGRALQMTMLDLDRIRLITRCRLSCHFAFLGDWTH